MEPIRVPGAIQPHGRMLVLSPSMEHVVAWSANLTDPAEALSAIRGAGGSAGFNGVPVVGASPAAWGTLALHETPFTVQVHRTPDHVIVEFEPCNPAGPGGGAEAPIYALGRDFLPRMQGKASTAELCSEVAVEMKRLSGFGRCLIYRFDDAGNGEVLAEALDPGYDSYSGHHFPASDIPAQARDLYVLNHFRLIADANYEPVPLLCSDPGLSPTHIDLSLSQLRSVSPLHLEYMRNMGTLASMSVSVVIEGRLWGLVSCHDHSPRHLDTATRLACEHLGHLLALQIQAREAHRQVAERDVLRERMLQIVSHLSESDGTLRQMTDTPELMLSVAQAQGAAVVRDDQVWTAGQVPAADQILALAQWVGETGSEVYSNSMLKADYPAAAAMQTVGAGVLALSISQVHRHFVLWFRPEAVQTVIWAGEPRKEIVEDGRIHPRRSFASWAEEFRGRSRAWTPAQVETIKDLRQALIGIVLRRAEEIANASDRLSRINKELEAFSYTVSHDLRAPMRHIAGYVDLVLEHDSRTLDERSLRYLGNVKEAAAYAGLLVDALLDFSRLGRSAVKRRSVDTGALVESVVADLMRPEPDRRVEWTIASDLPVLQADPLLLQVAVRNLVSNALKYSRGRDVAEISIRAVRTEQGEGLEVADNGAGFQMKYVDKLFGVFQRLHRAEEFEGTGIGLANVKRIVERHGGTVWARGELDRGASFGFVLPHIDLLQSGVSDA